MAFYSTTYRINMITEAHCYICEEFDDPNEPNVCCVYETLIENLKAVFEDASSNPNPYYNIHISKGILICYTEDNIPYAALGPLYILNPEKNYGSYSWEGNVRLKSYFKTVLFHEKKIHKIINQLNNIFTYTTQSGERLEAHRIYFIK